MSEEIISQKEKFLQEVEHAPRPHLDRKGSRYYGSDGNPDFRRHADPVDDHVCRPRIPMLVAGRAAEERGKGPQRSRKFLTRKINFPSHFLSFGLSG